MGKDAVFSLSESKALSVIRIVAMALIVMCHIAQCYGLKSAWLLNVGVQVFFFMSGFLYGKLSLPISPFGFYKKRFVKLYFPFIVWVAIVVCIYLLFYLYQPTIRQLVLYLFNLQWFATPIEGLNHLWFLTVLMICYLLTPWTKKLHEKNPVLFVMMYLAFCFAEFVLVRKFYSFCAWVALYFAGMLFGLYYSKKISNLVLLMSSIALGVLVVLFKPEWLTQYAFRYHTIWLHWIMGVFLFVALYRFLPQLIKQEKKNLLVEHFDKISYEVYLVHHPLILGPLSMMFITKYCWLNILMVLVATYTISRILHYVCSFTKRIA